MTKSKWPATLLFATLAGCSAGKGSTGGERSAFPSPTWFNEKPQHSPKSLFFTGDTSGQPDESTARELAVKKALAELTQYCGASITSESKSEEVYRNGETEMLVSVNVDISGDEMTIREATVSKVAVGKGSDGTFDGYVLLSWPRARYQEVLAAQSQRAKRALDKYLEAETAAEKMEWSSADTHLSEARSILGPMRTSVPLEHDRFGNTTLLYDAISALAKRLESSAQERKQVLAVAVDCQQASTAKTCPSHRVGAVKDRVASTGFKVSTDPVNDGVVSQILTAGAPSRDATLRSSGYVLAVRYEAGAPKHQDQFVFVYCGARAALYDTNSGRLVAVKDVPPQKGGHVNAEGAEGKGCDASAKLVLDWIGAELAKLK